MDTGRITGITGTALARFQRLVLNACAVAGTLCLLMALLALVFGIKPLVFVSGSMGPGIPSGSLGLAVPTQVADISPGDVVSVLNSESQRITHRVVENIPQGLVLKGDANPVPDLQPYTVSSVDKLIFSAPLLGYAVNWMSQPWAYFLGGVLCAYLLYLAFIAPAKTSDPPSGHGKSRRGARRRRATGPKEPDDAGTAKRTGLRNAVLIGVVAACLLGLGMKAPAPVATDAAFLGSARATASQQAATLAPPANTTCTNNAGNSQNIRFNWQTAGIAPTGFLVTAKLNGGAEIKSEALGASARSYTTGIASSNGLLGSLLDLLVGFDRTFTVSIYAQYNSWQSVPVSFTQVHATAGLLGANKQLTCTLH